MICVFCTQSMDGDHFGQHIFHHVRDTHAHTPHARPCRAVPCHSMHRHQCTEDTGAKRRRYSGHVRDGDEEQYRAPFAACFHVSIILSEMYALWRPHSIYTTRHCYECREFRNDRRRDNMRCAWHLSFGYVYSFFFRTGDWHHLPHSN